jgi:sphinganine-1-phosphate aldolase
VSRQEEEVMTGSPALPEEGRPATDLLTELRQTLAEDPARRLRLLSLRPDDALRHAACDLLAEVQRAPANADWTSPLARKLDAEVGGVVRPLFSAPADAPVLYTASGSESLLLALKAARDEAQARRPEVVGARVVAPVSVHPSVDKACQLLGLRVERVALTTEGRADVAALAAAIGDDTVALLCSLPSDSRGLCDPVPEIAALARQRGVWLHVDACLGGYLVPFLRDLGAPLPAFDFTLPGVRSLSADLHKYGYAPIGISTLLLRHRSDRELVAFAFEDWDGYPYRRESLAGTRSLGPLAGAWLTLLSLGSDGFRRRAAAIAATAEALARAIAVSPALCLLSPSEAGLVHFGSRRDRGGFGQRMACFRFSGSSTREPDGFIVCAGHAVLPDELSEFIAAAESIA